MGTVVTILSRRFSVGTVGDNELLRPESNGRLYLYKAVLSVNADITGEVVLRLGTTNIGGVLNPKSGNQYLLLNSLEFGKINDSVYLYLPSTTTVTLNLTYKGAPKVEIV